MKTAQGGSWYQAYPAGRRPARVTIRSPGGRYVRGKVRPGDQPVRRWIDHDLSAAQRRAVMAALKYLLAAEGIGICASEYGRHLGRGLFELRIRHDEQTIIKKAEPAMLAQTPPR